MSYMKRVFGPSALALAVSAPAAFADVSAADVWGQWKTQMENSGQTLTVGSESMVGDTLTISDLKTRMETPEAGFSVSMSSLTFKENGDGTVTIGMPDSYPMVLDIHPPGEDAGKVNLSVRQTGMSMTASGNPGEISYAYAGQEIAVMLDSIEVPDAEGVDFAGGLRLAGFAGTYTFGAGDVQPFSSTFEAASMTIDLDIQAPEEDGALTFNFKASDIKGTSDGQIPSGIDYNDMAAAMAAGFAVSGGLDFGATTYDFDFKDGYEAMKVAATMASGGISFDMSPEGMSYNTKSAGLDLTLSGSEIPLPQINLKMAESAFGLTMPITKSDAPQNVGLLLKVVDLAVPEDIWGMIDPAGGLPHDPATIIFDATGTANWLVDIMAPDAEQQMMSGGMPGQLHTLDLNELELSIAGASVTANGGFTFDNNDLMTWGGMPAPEGAIDVSLMGVNGLIDKLVGMGLLPQDQAMGGKMMMGMFAKPGDGPDTMTSKIEVKADGSVFANGQQLK
ncbi:DUF2125 domain-containing protein [Frigidibacter sp. ROC022]|uniref:DUF2125 domain-containing protein n=1 Tax=Frigidibacter sp. ROC022 TaxID=2971796 RepID=UPI00215AB8EF|nr:DUF2125 domain-containing protein [Frigidibacter sp. ROC022]MCR8724940.1 DUF2125 domain-containing protein [Frigidibacter sp. ROC022]